MTESQNIGNLYSEPCDNQYLSLKCKVFEIWLVKSACIYLIATLQISLECEKYEG